MTQFTNNTFDATIVDASRPPEEQYYRRAVREKYIGRPKSSAMNQYTDQFVSLLEIH